MASAVVVPNSSVSSAASRRRRRKQKQNASSSFSSSSSSSSYSSFSDPTLRYEEEEEEEKGKKEKEKEKKQGSIASSPPPPFVPLSPEEEARRQQDEVLVSRMAKRLVPKYLAKANLLLTPQVGKLIRMIVNRARRLEKQIQQARDAGKPDSSAYDASDCVFSLISGTGTGKTSLVPQILLRASLFEQFNFALRDFEKLFVLVPTIPAANSHYKYAITQNEPILINNFACRSARQNQGDIENAKVIYMTTQSGINELRRMARAAAGTIDRSFYFLDEAHHQSKETKLVRLIVWYLIEVLGFRLTAFIVTATPSPQLFEGFHLRDDHIVECPATQYPITIVWNEADDELTIPKILGRITHKFPGESILCFCPGEKEIDKAAEIADDQFGREYEIVTLFSSHYQQMSEEEQDRLTAPDKENNPLPRIIFATPIAESSMTFPDVKHVIPSKTHKVKAIDHNEMSSIREVAISQAAFKQQCGRAGRTGPGHAWAQISEWEFKSLKPHIQSSLESEIPTVETLELLLDEFPPDIILKSPYHNLIMKRLLNMELIVPIGSKKAKDLERVPYQDPRFQQMQVTHLVTAKGKRVASFGVSILCAAAILHAEEQTILLNPNASRAHAAESKEVAELERLGPEHKLLLAALSVAMVEARSGSSSLVVLPFESKPNEWGKMVRKRVALAPFLAHKRFNPYRDDSELGVCLRMGLELLINKIKGRKNIREWAAAKHLSAPFFNQALSIFKTLSKALFMTTKKGRQFFGGGPPSTDDYYTCLDYLNTAEGKRFLLDTFLFSFSDRIYKFKGYDRQRNPMYVAISPSMSKEEHQPDLKSLSKIREKVQPPQYILSITTTHIELPTRIVHVLSFAIPCEERDALASMSTKQQQRRREKFQDQEEEEGEWEERPRETAEEEVVGSQLFQLFEEEEGEEGKGKAPKKEEEKKRKKCKADADDRNLKDFQNVNSFKNLISEGNQLSQLFEKEVNNNNNNLEDNFM